MDVTGKGCATVTGVGDGKDHRFRLLSRVVLFELDVEDVLVQTYCYKPGAGRVGFVVRGAEAAFSDVKAWRTSLLSPDAGLPQQRLSW